jgi:hypothetical protein
MVKLPIGVKKTIKKSMLCGHVPTRRKVEETPHKH